MRLRMSMKGQLVSLAAFALLGTLVLAALAIGSNQVNQRALTRLYGDEVATLVRMQRIENSLLEVRFRAAGVLLEQLPTPGALNHIREVRTEISSIWAELLPTAERVFVDGDALEQFQRLRNNWRLVAGTLEQFEKAYLQKDTSLITTALEDDWPVLHTGAIKPLQALIPITQASAATDYEAAVAKSRFLLAAGLTTAVLCLIGLSVVAWLITRSLMRTMGAEPSDVAAVVQAVASGDLSADIRLSPGDTTSLMAQIKQMRHNLASTVGGVRMAAEAVASASLQIAQGSNDLSSRTSAQAAALQLTTASMQILGANVARNADNATLADQFAASAATVATKGGEVVAQVVDTMQGINDSSRRIAEIIGLIDGIAFQTNILALNAAVEAARAGELGRGFAVVATEVRSLARRSTEAAKEIKNLIQTSVGRVEQGTELVDRAGDTMTEVVSSIKRVTDIMAAINAASSDQRNGVIEVDHAVGQMDSATQQNAALVEQSAAAAESLKTHAHQLVTAVAAFKLAATSGRAV